MKQTNGGKWIYRDAEIHRCPKPGHDTSVKVGDRWQCDNCKKVWVVSKINHHFDPRPGESYSTLEWREHSSSPPAPSTTYWRD